ncbi:MAG: MBOAT family protein [Bacteroidales bacterium]|nr:MBOAT family protein [Bacteroidales bacterium]
MDGLREVSLQFLRDLFSFDQAHPLLFTQFYFWAFFAIVLAFLSFFKNKVLMRNAFLFFVSLFFYYKTSGLFLMLLGFTIVYNYFAGRLLPHCKRAFWRNAVVVTSVVVDLSLLCYYKYAYFITDVVNNLFGTSFVVKDWIATFGNSVVGSQAFSVDSIFLPVGISFFIFQAISYVVDVSRGVSAAVVSEQPKPSKHKYGIEPVRNFLDFGFYLSFFPQLVAGPIVRAKEFIPQLRKPFFLGRTQFGFAVFWILNGLAKKLVLSDYLAVNFCDRVFENPLLYTGFENLTALFGYSLQVYADFSGYTDIATGVAMLMGFYLPKNFNSPYKAKNAGEFWKRWHISLSKWLQDYLYIPLGGNRNGTFGSYAIILGIAFLASALAGSWWVFGSVLVLTVVIALLITFKKNWRKELISDINRMDTMLLGGLWHGASWNFMIWGGLNGLGMLIYRFWASCNAYFKVVVIGLIVAVFGVLRHFFGAPVFNLFFWWTIIILAGAIVGMLFHKCRKGKFINWISGSWAVLMTFIFITFTRLFFRSGSNLDPAEANEKAWNTAKNMVNQIGGSWDWSLVPQMAWQHRSIIIVFIVGMIIHWLPDNFKRRYRIWFAKMPLALMVLACAVAVFIICQFITADLQSFIYFQF